MCRFGKRLRPNGPRCMPHLRRIAPPGSEPVEVLRLVEPCDAGIGEPGI